MRRCFCTGKQLPTWKTQSLPNRSNYVNAGKQNSLPCLPCRGYTAPWSTQVQKDTICTPKKVTCVESSKNSQAERRAGSAVSCWKLTRAAQYHQKPTFLTAKAAPCPHQSQRWPSVFSQMGWGQAKQAGVTSQSLLGSRLCPC